MSFAKTCFAGCAFLLLASLCSMPAQARTKKVKVPDSTSVAEPDLILPVPHSYMEVNEPPKRVKNPTQFELSFSSWSPNHLAQDSYLATASDLQSTSLPKLSFNFWSGGWQNETLHLSTIWGLAFSQLQRDASLGFADQDSSVHQSVDFFSARVGLALTSVEPFYNLIRPYGSIALLPTLETAPTSAISDGISRSFLAAEVTAGLSFDIPSVSRFLGVNKFALEAGLDATTGTFGASYTGLGFLAGTRINL